MRTFALAGLLALALPAFAAGQDAPPANQDQQAAPPGAAADTSVVELVLRREVFSYPTFARRNPFAPLTSAEAGPRFDQMRLSGIVYYENDPARSIAVIAADAGVGRASAAPAEGGRGLVERLRTGERWGNVRIVRIEESMVVVDVNNFGIVERREMRLQSRGQGGS